MAKVNPKPLGKTYSSSSASGLENLVNKFPKGDGPILYDKINYVLMALGAVLIIIGFILMSGGANPDPNVFDDTEVYSATRITIAPIVIIIGFIIEIFAVLKKPAEKA